MELLSACVGRCHALVSLVLSFPLHLIIRAVSDCVCTRAFSQNRKSCANQPAMLFYDRVARYSHIVQCANLVENGGRLCVSVSVHFGIWPSAAKPFQAMMLVRRRCCDSALEQARARTPPSRQMKC